jgi:OPA family glycerol-3-phosphate transporter-like MFS transporter/OPA family sugar phosphate sensor protein UhpC-like MFS transporter
MLLSDSKGLSLAHSGWLVAMFEISGIVGMLAAGWATDRWLKGRAHRTCVLCMVGAAIFMLLFWRIPDGAPAWTMLVTLALAGFFIYGPQALIGIAAANQATKRAAATANGVTGIFGYASVLVSGWGLGRVAELYGWDPVYQIVIGIAVVGIFIFLAMWNAGADGYGLQEEGKTP